MKTNNSNMYLTFTAAVIASLALSLQVQAVSPAPDGGYPNFTTAEGDNALRSLTSGVGNTAVGTFSLFEVSTGSNNTAVGAGALDLNAGDSNTAIGTAALLLNTAGAENTAIGTAALEFNDSEGFNTAVGAFALFSDIGDTNNTAVGANAAFALQTGGPVTAVGANALFAFQTGGSNDAFGDGALANLQNGSNNAAFGTLALADSITGSYNTAVGEGALGSSSGDFNIALGFAAGESQGSGTNNIYIGDIGDPFNPNESNVIAIGRRPAGTAFYENTFIGGIYDSVVTDRIVYIDSFGHLGTLASSRRYKEEIKPMDKASEALFALKPVTFRYQQKIDPSHKLSFGLIAEDVGQVSSDLVSRDKEGKPQTVRYDQVNAMLLNEFLKEHKKVQRLEATVAKQEVTIAKQQNDFQATVAHQQKQIEALTAGLQKVSAQLEVNKTDPRTVNNP